MHSEQRESIVLSNDGQKIFGVFHRPANLTNYPAVLICHGLGGNKVGKQRLYVRLAQLLATQGIAALRIDFRGSGDSEGEFADMTVDAEVSDALLALKFLQNDNQVNPHQIGIFGRSFGGIVAVLAAHYFNLVKSIVLWAPVFSGEQWKEKWILIQQQKISREHSEELMKIEGMKLGRKFFEQLFALKVDSQIHALSHVPMLHIHGKKDSVVDLSHAMQFAKVREESKANNKFILLPESDHDFSNMHERTEALETTKEWFLETLD